MKEKLTAFFLFRFKYSSEFTYRLVNQHNIHEFGFLLSILDSAFKKRINQINKDCTIARKKIIPLHPRNFARVAELVDASVSKTDEVILVPVRSRPRVHGKPLNHLILKAYFI